MKNKTINVKSIKFRLLIVPLIFVLMGVLIIGIVSSVSTRNALLDEVRKNGFSTADKFVDRINGNREALDTVDELLEAQIRTVANVVIGNSNLLSNQYLTTLAQQAGIDEIYWYNANGTVVYGANGKYVGWTASPGDPIYQFMTSSEMERMEEIRKSLGDDGKETGEAIKCGYIKNSTGDFVQVAMSAKRVLELQNAFDYQALMEEMARDKNVVFALLIDSNYKAIAQVGKVLSNDDKDLKKAIQSGKRYSRELYFKKAGVDVCEVIYPVERDGKIIGAIDIGYSLKDIQTAIQKKILFIAIISLIVFLLIGFLLFGLSNNAIGVINKLKQQMEYMAKGDFSVELPQDLLKNEDEFGQISKAMHQMQLSIREIISNVISKSEQVALASEKLTATSQQSAIATEEVAKTIEEIAIGASKQAKDTETAAANVEALGSLLEEDADYLKELNNAAHVIDKQKEEGFSILKTLIEKTEKNNNAVGSVYQNIVSNNESAEKIERASTMIQSIADQTNLLALNAAIEAARAGEAGRGFAVVADEIRKLAEQSNSFTNDIKAVIEELKLKSQSAVKTMQEVTIIVDAQTQSVKETEGKFHGIAAAIETITKIIERLNHSAELMEDNKNKIIELTQNLSAISEENAAGTEEVSASMEEQAAAVEGIANSGESLATIAAELKTLIEEFRVEKVENV